MRRSDITDLPCLVFQVEEIREEANGFLNVNTNRKSMKYLDRFKALVTSGDDDAIFVKGLIQLSNRVAGEGSNNEIRCVGALMYWAKRDRNALVRVWPTLDKLSPETPISVQLVDGLMYLEMSISPSTISNPSVHQRLIQIGQVELLHAAREAAHYYGKGGARIWAEGILKRYNKGLRNKLSINEN